MKTRVIAMAAAVCVLITAAICGCSALTQTNPSGGSMQQAGNNQKRNSNAAGTQDPYAVKTFLHEEAAADPETGNGIYVRYTQLVAEDNVPESLQNAIAQCNARAKEAAQLRLEEITGAKTEQVSETGERADYDYAAYSYIGTLTRADAEAFSILETEYMKGTPQIWDGRKVTCRFRSATYDTANGDEILLTDLTEDMDALSDLLREALEEKYGTDGLAETQPSDYAWTADALEIRFYFHSDSVSAEKRSAINDHSNTAITAAIPYDALHGPKAEQLANAPEAYIARIEQETVYDLPHGDLSIMLTKQDTDTVIRMMPDQGEDRDYIIENADDRSDYYIIRSKGSFYLFRQRIANQEGFFYDFDRPDGGFGRFAYHNAQYFDSFLREIGLALPYNPYCAHMCEIRRSFGNNRYDAASFVPHGHYSFPDHPDSINKGFLLIDDRLQIDTGNTACRLLEDLPVTQIDAEGNELGEDVVKAGTAIVFETVRGEADRYLSPVLRGRQKINYEYDCRLPDGTRIRFISGTEGTLSVGGKYLNRFTEVVSLPEAELVTGPDEQEIFTVRIGEKDYPLISDYSRKDHAGEEIDFGDELWWQTEGYVGRYEMTQEDRKQMESGWFTQDALAREEGTAALVILDDGRIRFDYFGEVYDGELPESRYYKTDVSVTLASEHERREFLIIVREGNEHDTPQQIEFYSEGLPATNAPSTQPPLSVYLTRQ